jgi:hypothetical protein
MITYFSWWYGQGLVSFWQAILVMTGKIYSYFSISILLRTLFDPWKRDNFKIENASLQDRMKLASDNLISRLVGFVIRLFTMIFGLLATVLFFVIMFLILLIWLLLPVVIIGLIVNGIRVVTNG